METISVIVPVYNTEKYLDECVQSILNQTYSAIELILVDDGSTDGSGEICDCFAAKDRRVKVHHRENQGVSAARNFGTSVAVGQWVAFVDSDDTVHPQYLEVLLAGVQQTSCAVSICGYQTYAEGNEAPSVCVPEKLEFEKLSRHEVLSILNEWRSEQAVGMVTPWNKLYRRELLQIAKFPEGVRHEDEFFAHRLLNQCEKAAFLWLPLYNYRINEHGFMGNVDAQKTFAHLVLFDALMERIDFFQEHEPSLVTGAMHRLLRECNSFYDEYSQFDEPVYREKQRWLVQTYRKAYLKYFGRISMQERAKGALFAIFPEIYHKISLKRWNRQT